MFETLINLVGAYHRQVMTATLIAFVVGTVLQMVGNVMQIFSMSVVGLLVCGSAFVTNGMAAIAESRKLSLILSVIGLSATITVLLIIA